MASTEQLKQALVQAHRAGDTQAAQLFAGMIKSQDTRPQVGTKTGLLGQFGQAATFGFADELIGGTVANLEQLAQQPTAQKVLGAVSPIGLLGNLAQAAFQADPETRREARDFERAAAERFQEENPVASGVARVAGVVPGAIAGGGLLAGTRLGANLAGRVASQGLGGRVGTAAGVGAGVGALEGAAQGAGEAETLADVPAEAASQAGFGAAGGAIFGPLGELAGTGLRTARDVFRNVTDPAQQAAKQVSEALPLGPTVEAARAQAPGGILADVNERTLGLLDNAANQPGPARDMARQVLEQRSRSQAATLTGDIGPGKKFETLEQLAQVRQQQSAPLYERAFAQGVEHNETLEGIFNTLQNVSPGIWKKARKLGQLKLDNEGIKADLGTKTRPSLQGWQFMKEKLDDEVGRLYRRGEKKEAGALATARSRLLEELDSQNPDFAQARQLWAGTKEVEDLMAEGDAFMRLPASQFNQVVKDMGESEMEAVRIGAVQAIEDRLDRNLWTADATRVFRTPAMEKKLKILFRDKPGEFEQFMGKIDILARQQEVKNAALSGSQTAKRLAQAKDVDDWVSAAVEALPSLAAGVPTSAGAAVGAARQASKLGGKVVRGLGGGRVLDAAAKARENARTEVARILLAQPQQQAQELARIQALLANPPRTTPGLLPGLSGGLVGAGIGAGLLQ